MTPAAATLARTFGLAEGRRATAVAAGEMGRILRLETACGPYAIKEHFWGTDEQTVRREVSLRDAAVHSGIRAPANVPGPDGAYVQKIHARDYRCYEWIDGSALAAGYRGRAEWLGRTLAALHGLDLAYDVPADPWYDTPPTETDWDRLAAEPQWAQPVGSALPRVRALTALAEAADPDLATVFTHRDLRAQNVLVDARGPVLLDWEDAGPAVPARSLAGALWGWYESDSGTDVGGLGATVRAYRGSGGTAMIDGAEDFAVVAAVSLNFVMAQARLALDPEAAADKRHRAAARVPGLLANLPDPQRFAAVAELAAAAQAAAAQT